MGILDSIVEWIATQVMNLLDLITGSVLGALGCDMSTFLRYFPAAETLYEIFVAIGVGFILLNLVWQLFRNFGLGLGLSAEDPVKLAIKSILFIFLALFADQIMVLVLGIVGTPYDWVVDTALPPIEFASFASVVTVLVGSLVSGSVSLIVLILVLIVSVWRWNPMAERKSICPMVRCFAAITSMPPNYMAQMRRKRVRPRCICKRNSDMTNHTPCLLDEAATFMKVQYLSYLRFLSTDGRSRLAAFLETFDAAEYILFQWNDAIEYLKAGVKQQTAQVARAQLLRALRTT